MLGCTLQTNKQTTFVKVAELKIAVNLLEMCGYIDRPLARLPAKDSVRYVGNRQGLTSGID